MKTVVIKFRKTKHYLNKDPYDTDYSCITGGSIVNVATDLAHYFEGYVKSFNDKNADDLFSCKLVVRIPKENESKFINNFVKKLNRYIEEIRW